MKNKSGLKLIKKYFFGYFLLGLQFKLHYRANILISKRECELMRSAAFPFRIFTEPCKSTNIVIKVLLR
tara:strand:- start:579 stop:785 length:207 start_codon:yes stop_codon:yes gene_type:complete